MKRITILVQPVVVQQALRVIAEPQANDSPGLRKIAWAVLKTAKGQTTRQAKP